MFYIIVNEKNFFYQYIYICAYKCYWFVWFLVHEINPTYKSFGNFTIATDMVELFAC